MRWSKPNLKSIYGLWGHAGPLAAPTPEPQLPALRKAMLDAMAAGTHGEQQRLVIRKIVSADSIQTLWYARTDLMHVLAGELGETAAEKKMAALTKLFKGLLPEARVARKSRGSIQKK